MLSLSPSLSSRSGTGSSSSSGVLASGPLELPATAVRSAVDDDEDTVTDELTDTDETADRTAGAGG